MRNYEYALKILAILIFVISSIHIAFGVSSETFLGSSISQLSLSDPNLDSQNRFYGASFALFGAVFWLASTNLVRYATLLNLAFAIFFLAGMTRLISIALVGWPTPLVVALIVIELAGPPAMYYWLRGFVGDSSSVSSGQADKLE